ncbi:Hypothetical protein AA314_07744 [Archangium gephyra]|uniref:Uncharacterized protein n=1 Tax=Archangium gephyra TaxID=48 RepID=A0AAC8THG8_9BACT|nr:Hypothetical protein AA314_07744 [Archangium gephyra]
MLGGSGGEGDAVRGHTHPRQRGDGLLSRVATSSLYEDRQKQQRGHDQAIPWGHHVIHAPARVGCGGRCCDGAGSLSGAPNAPRSTLFVSRRK